MIKTNFLMEDNYITMVRGDTLSFGVEIEKQDGTPLDIDSAFFTCKKSYTGEAFEFQKSMNSGISKESAGKYIVRVAPEDTASMESGKYFYDFQISSDSDVFTIMRGTLEIEQDFTN